MTNSATFSLLFLVAIAPSLMVVGCEAESRSVTRGLSLTALVMGFVWILTVNPAL